MIKKYCPICKTERSIDIAKVFGDRKKTKVLCGHCASVLLASRVDIENAYYWYYSCD